MAMVGHLPSWPILDCECSIKPFFIPPCDKEEHIYAGKHKYSVFCSDIREKTLADNKIQSNGFLCIFREVYNSGTKLFAEFK